MKKAKRILTTSVTLLIVIWVTLGIMAFTTIKIGNQFFNSGKLHVYSAELAMNFGYRDEALSELRKAAEDAITGHRTAVVAYSIGQILVPWKWNDFSQLRVRSITEIEKVKNDLNTTLAN